MPIFSRFEPPSHGKTLDHFAIDHDLDRASGLAHNGSWIAAHKGVATQVLTTFDGFKKKGLAGAADFTVCRQWRFNVGQQSPSDRHEIALRREFLEFL